MLFNYSNCLSCKRNVDDVKITLHQLFPSNICNKICEYNVHCKYCHLLVEDERKFSKHQQEENVSKIELQLRFFHLYNKPPFEYKDLQKVKIQKMKEIIDKSYDHDIMYKKAMKSYMTITFGHRFKRILPFVGKKKILKENTEYLKGEYFSYYNYLYREDTLTKFIMYEYILELIGDDIEYMHIEDIHNYLDEILPK